MTLIKKLTRLGAIAALVGICLFIALVLRFTLIGFLDPAPGHQVVARLALLHNVTIILAAGTLLAWAVSAGLWIAAIVTWLMKRPLAAAPAADA